MVQFEYLENQLTEIKSKGHYRYIREIESAQGPVATINGKKYVLFCSNNYLSLADDPRIIESAKNAIEKYGYGSGASRLISGTMQPHIELENRLADFVNKEAALLFTSGWCANQAVITTLPQKGDLVLLDKLDHASIIDAAKLSPAEFRTYQHNDFSKLIKYLESEKYNRKFIITESIFSMDGDCADIKKLVELKEKYNAILIVDEAHSIGCMGDKGSGFCQKMGVLDKIDIIIATLSKAFGASGGFVAGPKVVKEFLINKARSLIYTTAPSPINSVAVLSALEIIQKETKRRKNLQKNINYLQNELHKIGVETGQSSSQIIPVIIGDDFKVVEIANELYDKGFFVPAIRPPTVARGSSRLRISLQANHTKEQLDGLCSAIKASLQK